MRYHIAVALDRLDKPAEARRELEKALRNGGGFPGASEAQALLQKLTKAAQ